MSPALFLYDNLTHVCYCLGSCAIYCARLDFDSARECLLFLGFHFRFKGTCVGRKMNGKAAVRMALGAGIVAAVGERVGRFIHVVIDTF